MKIFAFISVVLAVCHGFSATTATQPWVLNRIADATNALPRSAVGTNDVRGIVGAFAGTGTVYRASSVGDGVEWTDATGCVWRIENVWVTTGNEDYEDILSSVTYTYVSGQDPDQNYGHDRFWIPVGLTDEWYSYPILNQNYTASPDDTYLAGIYLIHGGEDIGPLSARLTAQANIVGRVALTNDIPRTAADVGAYPAASGSELHGIVNTWQTYWDGDDVRLTVTNYFGSADVPHLYIEQKMPADDTHDEPWFKTIWDEITRHAPIISRIAALETNLADKADRAWGFYDSHTGEYSPDGYTSISSSNIMIAAGMAYQKTVTTDGEVWVLTATEPTTISGVTSNGFFRIEDGDGNALFEIIKGDKRTVGATAGSIRVTGDEVQIGYALADNSSVVISYTTDLKNGMWQNVEPTWTGTSGNYTAHVQKPNSPCAFFKATYEIGGETYIRNSAPVSTDRVVIGGNFYRVSVETVNGKKLMVLTDD